MVYFLMRARKQYQLVFGISLVLAIVIFSFGLEQAMAADTSMQPQMEGVIAQTGKPDFKDLNADSRLLPFVHYLAAKGIIKGFPDGTFRPADGVTRAEAARIIVLTKGLFEDAHGQPVFKDVPIDHWAFGTIQAATKAGLLNGYPDGTFKPDAPISRAEAVSLLLRLSGGALTLKNINIGDVDPDNWAYRQVATAIEAGIVELSADRLFNPDESFRRGDLATGLSAVLTLGPALRETDMIGKLVVREGKATVNTGSEVILEVNKEMPVGAGVKVNTGEKCKAEITFDDGSGVLLDENTEITITKSKALILSIVTDPLA